MSFLHVSREALAIDQPSISSVKILSERSLSSPSSGLCCICPEFMRLLHTHTHTRFNKNTQKLFPTDLQTAEGHEHIRHNTQQSSQTTDSTHRSLLLLLQGLHGHKKVVFSPKQNVNSEFQSTIHELFLLKQDNYYLFQGKHFYFHVNYAVNAEIYFSIYIFTSTFW